MIRHFVSVLLAGSILLTQVGLPVHLHYCKGILESASIFFKAVCEEHAPLKELRKCCQNTTEPHCKPGDNGCCDDETKVVTKSITSVAPSFSLDLAILLLNEYDLASFNISTITKPVPVYAPATPINGPPVYILHHSLILYA